MAVQFAKTHMSAVGRSSRASTGGPLDALSRRLLTAASAAALAAGAPALVTPAHAQLPAGCSPTNPTAGQTVTCTGNITEAVSAIEGDSTDVADLTVNIGVDGGDAATVTVADGDAVRLAGNGTQTVNISAGSSVSGSGGGGSPAGVGVFSLDGGDVTVNAEGQISGGFNGLEATTGGAGNINISVTDVSAAVNDGMNINLNDGATGDISITATGLVTGGRGGIALFNRGSGVATANVVDVTANGAYGITGVNSADTDGSFSITATGLIQGEKQGVYIIDQSHGSVTLDLAHVSSNTNAGIAVTSFATAEGEISVSASATVQGETEGVRIVNGGAGDVVLDLADVAGNTAAGVYVHNQSTSTGDVSVTASGVVSGYTRGVDINNDGTGGVTLDLADVASNSAAAVFVDNEAASTGDVSISVSGQISGGDGGVDVRQRGSGGVMINTAGVTTQSDDGIYVQTTTAGAGDVSITASGAISANSAGVVVEHEGTGAVTVSVASITANGGNGIEVDTDNADAGDISISATGGITGRSTGIEVDQEGTGGVMINAADVTATGSSSSATGINVDNETGSLGGVTITAGAVSGVRGVLVQNNGVGGVSVDVASAVGSSYFGMRVRSRENSTGDISVTATGEVSGGADGLDISNQGQGDAIVNIAGAVTGTSEHGVYVQNGEYDGAYGGAVSIAIGGAVTGGQNGVFIYNRSQDAGDIDITVAGVTGGSAAGVYVNNTNSSFAGDTSVTASGAVVGETRGVYIKNQGTGGVTLDLASVTGTTQEGVFVSSTDNSNSDLSITASGAVSGASHGVNVDNDSYGGVTVNIAGAVTGTSANGINVDNDYGGGAVSITAGGAVTGGQYGVFVDNDAYGSGNVNISVAGVTGENAAGIRVMNTDRSFEGDTFITASGAVVGETHGVYVDNEGTGSVTLDLASVTGTTDRALSVRSGVIGQGGEGGVSITASGAVASSSRTGVYVRNRNTGAVTLDLVSVASDGNAIEVDAAGDVSITASGAVSGENTAGGVYGKSSGGDVDISVADVTGDKRAGIYADISAGGGDISITASGAVVGFRGVRAVNDGGGAVTIDVVDVAGGGGMGIEVLSQHPNQGGDISITASGMVQSNARAVLVANNGRGDVTLDLANVDGGIDVRNADSRAGNASITVSGAVTGGQHGVDVDNDGYGVVSINVAAVTGASENGINVENDERGGAVSITAGGAVTSGQDGVFVENGAYGSGNVDISVAAVTGTSGAGIRVANTDSSFTGDTSITASGAISGVRGVEVSEAGDGAVAIGIAGVSASGGHGVLVDNTNTAGGDISVAASGDIFADVSSGVGAGVEIRNQGAGAVTLDLASVTTPLAQGVLVSNGANSMGDVSIAAGGTVLGGFGGVHVTNEGAGGVALNVAAVSASFAEAVLVSNGANSMGDISITASGAVDGDNGGVHVTNQGAGGVTLDVAEVSASRATGILVTNDSGAVGDISIAARGAVSGGETGVEVRNLGVGAVDVALLGDVTGGSSGGVQIDNQGSGGVSVDVAGRVTKAGGAGVAVLNAGDGGVSISVGGDVSGAGNGVAANNTGDGDLAIAVGGDIDITTSAGVQATNRGDGDLSITTNGAVRNSGVGFGIFATNEGAGDVMIVADGEVSGSLEGVLATNTGAGATTITLAGAVSTEAENLFGLRTEAAAGASVTIDAGGSVTGGAGAISFDGDGADVLTLNAGASVNGLAALNGGDDTLRLAGGAFTEIQGGEGNNTVFLSGSSRTVDGLVNGAGEALDGFETLNIDGDGLVLAGTFGGFERLSFLTGANTLTGTIDADRVSIAPDATLIAGALTVAAASSADRISTSSVSSAVIDGDLTNSGVLNIAGSGTIGRLEVTGDFSQEDGAALVMDVSNEATDVLSVGGDVIVAGDLVVEGSLAGTQAGENTIRLIEGGGTLSGRLNVIADEGVLVQRELVFDDAGGNVDLVVTLNDLSAVEGLNPNQSNVGDTILTLINDGGLDPALADYISGILGLDSEEEVAVALAQLHPEALDFGLKSITASQRLFTESMRAHGEGGRPDAGARAMKLRSGATFWASVQGAGLGQDGQEDNTGFDGAVLATSAGIAGLEAGRFSFGIAGGFSQFDGETDGSFGDGLKAQFYHIGASLGLDLDDAVADGWLIRADAIAAFAGGETELSMTLLDPEDGGRLNQQGEADMKSLDISSRLTLAGVRGREWPLVPYTEFGVQIYRQDETRIGIAQPAGLQIDELHNTVGFAGVGVIYEQRWGDRLIAHGRAAGVRYFGDTRNTFNSRFAAALNGPAFQTAGQEINTQVEVEAALTYQHESGFTANMAAFGETGDLDVYGARFTISRKF